MTDYYLLTTGGFFQFWSALEYRMRHKDRNSVVVIPKNLVAVAGLADEYWNEVWRGPQLGGFPDVENELALYLALTMREAKRALEIWRLGGAMDLESSDRLVVGVDVRESRLLWHLKGKGEYVILDDGTSAIERAQVRRDELCSQGSPSQGKGARVRQAIDSLLRTESGAVLPSIYFSAILEKAPTERDRLLRHRFQHVSSLFSTSTVVDESRAMLLLTRTSRRQEPTHGQVLRWLRNLCIDLDKILGAGAHLEVAPHPADRQSGLLSSLPVPMREADGLPIELSMLRQAVVPGRLYCMPSSAVVILDALLPATVRISVVKPSSDTRIPEEYRSHLSRLEKVLKNVVSSRVQFGR